MKIVLWIGSDFNQLALSNKISKEFEIEAIFIEKPKSQNVTFRKILSKIFEKLFLRKIDKAWFSLQNKYKLKYKDYPKCNLYFVDNINKSEVFEITKSINPFIILVSGTSLIKSQLLELEPTFGILNLHTGLSPYIKGGPNCTNWCIAKSLFHLIGNTIMYIDKGIDSGGIIYSEYTKFDGNEDLNQIHEKVMEQAHDMYLKVLRQFKIKGKLNATNQKTISKGVVFYNKQWTVAQKIQLIKNLKLFSARFSNSEKIRFENNIITVNHIE